LKICDIGDILLFRGKHFGAKITRGVTNSTFGNFNIYNFIRPCCDDPEIRFRE